MREILTEIAANTAKSIGTEFLAALVKSMREAMDVKLVFVTTGIGDPPRRARSMASWQEGGALDTFEYDLEGTPCRLVYDGETVVVSEALYRKYEREANYEGYIGVPLRAGSGKVMGHLAVLSEHPLSAAGEAEAIVKLFGLRAEAELQRLEHERERDALIASLSRLNRRLSNRHNALRDSNESKTLLLGMVAHDLRNPLAAILSRSELIQALLGRLGGEGQYVAKARDSCDIITNSVEWIDRLIESVLSQAKAEAASVSVDMQDFPARRAIESAVALNAMAADRKSIAIVHDGTEDVMVRGDEDRIVEALDNLIRNAIKYSHSGQRISVGARRCDDGVDFFVSDQGQGLTEEDRARAFRQFQRLSAKPTGGESSTGLGLAIVKAIAEAHGGSAAVESPGPNRGAIFTLRLPHAAG